MKTENGGNSVFCDICGKRLKVSNCYFVYEGQEIYVDFKAEVSFKRIVPDDMPDEESVPDICNECADRLMKNMKRKQ